MINTVAMKWDKKARSAFTAALKKTVANETNTGGEKNNAK